MSDKSMVHHVKIKKGQHITQTERLEGRKRIRRTWGENEVIPCTEKEKESLIKRGLAENAPRASFPGFKPKPKEGGK